VKIDIPNSDKELKAKNQKVLEKYKVSGVPTVILLDPKGKEFSRFTASKFNSVDKMLAELKQQLRRKDMF
jgi:thioredoxin-related protein